MMLLKIVHEIHEIHGIRLYLTNFDVKHVFHVRENKQ
jgi:hypothetical protein